MGCAAKVSVAITNNCTDVPSAGMELVAYVFDRLSATFTGTDNLFTAIALSGGQKAWRVTAVKKEFDAGFDLVTADNIPSLFTNSLSLQPYSRTAAQIKYLDTVDDFCAVVELKGPKTEGKFVILGKDSGLHLKAASFKASGNYGIPTYEFATMDGETEVYSRRVFWITDYATTKAALETLAT